MNNNSKNKKVVVTKNGPYLVFGKVFLSEEVIKTDKEGYSTKWTKGKKYPNKEKCALCRCGQSGNKPFCDASHMQSGSQKKSR